MLRFTDGQNVEGVFSYNRRQIRDENPVVQARLLGPF